MPAVVANSCFAAEPVNADPFPQPKSKKGLQVQMIDDALALGIEHATLNVDLTRLIDPAGKTGGPVHERGEQRFSFSKSAVEDLDSQVKQLSDRGVVVYLILLALRFGRSRARRVAAASRLCPRAERRRPDRDVQHDDARIDGLAGSDGGVSRFPLQPAGEHGRVWGYIAGNEANSHWFWANMGLASTDEVVAAYERGVRTIHTAVRTASANARVYISLEHCWARRYAGGNGRQCIAGRTFLDSFAALARAERRLRLARRLPSLSRAADRVPILARHQALVASQVFTGRVVSESGGSDAAPGRGRAAVERAAAAHHLVGAGISLLRPPRCRRRAGRGFRPGLQGRFAARRESTPSSCTATSITPTKAACGWGSGPTKRARSARPTASANVRRVSRGRHGRRRQAVCVRAPGPRRGELGRSVG